MIRLAHLSDLHLVGEPGGLTLGKDCAANLSAVLENLPERPDVVVVTGDVAHEGSARAYELARSLMSKPACDVHFIAGNHDDTAEMARILDAGDDFRMVPLGAGWSLALVSSKWIGFDAGRVADETLARVDDGLARTTDSVVACLHHPPVSTCHEFDCSLDNAAEVERVLARPGNVRAVLSGHLHRSFDLVRNGTVFLGGPSTFEQLVHGGEPHFTPTDEPPAARMIELGDDGGVTHRLFSPERPQ